MLTNNYNTLNGYDWSMIQVISKSIISVGDHHDHRRWKVSKLALPQTDTPL